MARSVDLEDLSHEDLLYMSTREWLIREAEFLGVEDIRSRVESAVQEAASEAADEEQEEDEENYAPDYESWTVDALKVELKERSLSTSGNKTELIARIEEADGALDQDEEEEEDGDEEG